MKVFTAIPKHWFANSFDVFQGGRQIAEVSCPYWRERAKILFDGKEYFVKSSGWPNTTQCLELNAQVIGWARQPWLLRYPITVSFPGIECRLGPAWPIFRRHLLREQGTVVGNVAPLHPLTNRLCANLPDHYPQDICLFISWLVIYCWFRHYHSAG